MARSRLASIPLSALATAVLLAGCGGGGGGGGNSGGGTEEVGRVLDLSGVAVTGAAVRYYGSAGNTVLGSGVIGADGKLPTPVPAGATRFSVDASAIPDGSGGSKFYSTFSYLRDYYDDSAGCFAPLPQAGSAEGFTEDIFFFTRAFSPPPPPISGCIGG